MVLPEDLVPSPGHRLSSIISKAEKALGTRLGQCCWLSIHAGLSIDRSAVNYALTRLCARVNLCPVGFSCCIKLDGQSNLQYC